MLTQILGTFDPLLAIQFVVQVLLALLLGALVGLDRERHNMPAGVRTFALVSAGACLFTLLSYHSFPGGDRERKLERIGIDTRKCAHTDAKFTDRLKLA